MGKVIQVIKALHRSSFMGTFQHNLGRGKNLVSFMGTFQHNLGRGKSVR
jgi:hypothetical protein